MQSYLSQTNGQINTDTFTRFGPFNIQSLSRVKSAHILCPILLWAEIFDAFQR